MHRSRRAFTMVELMVSSALVALFLILIYNFFIEGRRTMESTERKVDAITQTHRRFEEVRHDLECSRWAWIPPQESGEAEGAMRADDTLARVDRAMGGGPLLYAGGREYAYDRRKHQLFVGGVARSGTFYDVRFWGQPEFVSKFAVCCSRVAAPSTRRPEFRECSSLLSKVFVEAQAEEVRARNHVHEAGHAWCVMGAPIHYGFDD
jgi:prepilin-type N-terminal cleavage/methylation domain-containing protein